MMLMPVIVTGDIWAASIENKIQWKVSVARRAK
jgi:hypothetical protein